MVAPIPLSTSPLVGSMVEKQGAATDKLVEKREMRA
jgi:hypothetical protein